MIAIIGKGNVGTHLYNALKDKTQVALVDSRTLEHLPENASLFLLCVADDAIAEVAAKLPQTEAIVAHTSGSVPMEALKRFGLKSGVVYPLQTFSKNSEINYKEIPVFIEGGSEATKKSIKDFASLISQDIREADSSQRRQLHLASVFACNFTNALAGIAEDILKEAGLDFSALLPLMKQTVDKLESMSPREAQTGPAARGDASVMEKHISMLENKPEYRNVYSQISEIIRNSKKNEI